MEQQELPLAMIRGEAFVDKPSDLYIPDAALEIRLDEFEGPLDLLLYLIKKQKFDIADLPIAPITTQYFSYIEQMEQHQMDLSAEYLVMAATLAHIKSKLLLPKIEVEEDEDDPRAELVKRLQEYQQIKTAAYELSHLPREERDFFIKGYGELHEQPTKFDEVTLADLVSAFQRVLKSQANFEHHHVQREAIATHVKMVHILSVLASSLEPQTLVQLLILDEGRQGAVVTFLAILELLKLQKISCEVLAEQLYVQLRAA